MTRKACLLVLMNPPSAFDEEFNAWYDTEHIPERLAVPGIETGLRYGSVGPAPRYLAIYDLSTLAVMDSPEYLRVALDQSSPWTRRVTARANVQRFTGEQVWPGDRLTGRAAQIGLVRFRGLDAAGLDAAVAGMRAIYEDRPEVRQVRVLADSSAPDAITAFGVVEAATPLPASFDPAAFGIATAAIDLVNFYVPL